MKPKILVTGGSGLIGSRLCTRLIERGNSVICLDNLSSSNRTGISHLLKNPSFHFLEQDVLDPLDLAVDQIYNLACPSSPGCYQADPVKTMKTNVLGALNVLELARKNKAMIFQASTSEVYGDPLEHPQKESYQGQVNPVGVRSCYDEGKRAAEALFFDFHRQYGVDIRVARIFNTYGPGMLPDDGRIVSNFIVQALKGEDLTIYGDGLQTRSFCYVEDMVTGILRLMDSKPLSTPVNLGNPQEITVLDFARMVLSLTGSRSALTHKPLPLDDPKKRCPDITLATTELGWKPTIGLQEGLKETIAYFQQSLL